MADSSEGESGGLDFGLDLANILKDLDLNKEDFADLTGKKRKGQGGMHANDVTVSS